MQNFAAGYRRFLLLLLAQRAGNSRAGVIASRDASVPGVMLHTFYSSWFPSYLPKAVLTPGQFGSALCARQRRRTDKIWTLFLVLLGAWAEPW